LEAVSRGVLEASAGAHTQANASWPFAAHPAIRAKNELAITGSCGNSHVPTFLC
jgi:hypothetical protein